MPEVKTMDEIIATDPLAAGVQFGIIGTGLGLSYAALQRAVLHRMGRNAPRSVLKPAVIGTLIGSALGYGGTAMSNRQRQVTPPQKWRDDSANLYQSKYAAGLHYIVHRNDMGKEAQAWETAKAIADTGTYFIPGVGTARLGWDAAKSLGKGLKGFAQGDWKAGLGGLGGGIANALFAGASLLPFGAALGALGKGGKAVNIARAATEASKGLKGIKALSAANKAKILGRITNVGRKLSEGQRAMALRAGERMSAIGKPLYSGKATLAGMGAMGVGAGFDMASAAEAAGRPRPRLMQNPYRSRSPYARNSYRGLARMTQAGGPSGGYYV